jgi:hypothetical protein
MHHPLPIYRERYHTLMSGMMWTPHHKVQPLIRPVHCSVGNTAKPVIAAFKARQFRPLSPYVCHSHCIQHRNHHAQPLGNTVSRKIFSPSRPPTSRHSKLISKKFRNAIWKPCFRSCLYWNSHHQATHLLFLHHSSKIFMSCGTPASCYLRTHLLKNVRYNGLAYLFSLAIQLGLLVANAYMIVAQLSLTIA